MEYERSDKAHLYPNNSSALQNVCVDSGNSHSEKSGDDKQPDLHSFDALQNVSSASHNVGLESENSYNEKLSDDKHPHPDRQSSDGLQNVFIVEQGQGNIATTEDVLEQLIQKVPIILTPDLDATAPQQGESGKTPVYILSPPHQCKCGAKDCSVELNQNKLRQILELKRLIENGQDLSGYLQTGDDQLKKSETIDKNMCKKVKKKFVCRDCEKRFRSEEALVKHSKRHTGEKPYRCKVDMCKETFASSKLMKEHLANCIVHACPFCQDRFESEYSLNEHLKIHKEYECNICHKTFTILNHYLMHMVVHSEKRPHACEKCGKSFKLSGNLSVHKKHCGKPHKLHECRFCERYFKNSITVGRSSKNAHKRETVLVSILSKVF